MSIEIIERRNYNTWQVWIISHSSELCEINDLDVVCVAGLISGLGQQEQDWWLLRPTVGHDRTPPELQVRFRHAHSQVFHSECCSNCPLGSNTGQDVW